MQKEVSVILLAVLLVASVGAIFLIKENYGQAILSRASTVKSQATVQTLPALQQIPAQPRLSTKPVSIITPTMPRCPTGTVVPYSNMIITNSTTFCPGTYFRITGMSVQGSNIVLDCNGATFEGDFDITKINQSGYSSSTPLFLEIFNSDTVEVKNCNVRRYEEGVVSYNSNKLSIHDNKIAYAIYGLRFMGIPNSKIFENTIERILFTGIFLSSSTGNKVYQNTLNDYTHSWLYYPPPSTPPPTPPGGEGEPQEPLPPQPPITICPGVAIHLIDSSDNEIILNTIERICKMGIILAGSPPTPHGQFGASKRNKVLKNELDSIYQIGILTSYDENAIIEKNTVRNTPSTITLGVESQALINYNNFYLINQNDPQDNQGGPNTWANNFYSDVGQTYSTCTDANSDDICDIPRSIYGSTGSRDQTPSKIPN